MTQEAPKPVSKGIAERRAFPRWPVRLSVQYGSAPDLAVGEASDISESGLGFRGEKPYAVGAEIEIKFCFDLPGAKWFRAKALVRRFDKGTFGVEFVGMPPAERSRLRQAIHAYVASQR